MDVHVHAIPDTEWLLGAINDDTDANSEHEGRENSGKHLLCYFLRFLCLTQHTHRIARLEGHRL